MVPLFGSVDGQRSVEIPVHTRQVCKMPIVFLQLVEFFLAPFFKVNQAVARTSHCSDEFIQFQLNSLVFLVLRALDQEDHQEGDDCGARVDYELPRIGKTEKRAGNQPHYD